MKSEIAVNYKICKDMPEHGAAHAARTPFKRLLLYRRAPARVKQRGKNRMFALLNPGYKEKLSFARGAEGELSPPPRKIVCHADAHTV